MKYYTIGIYFDTTLTNVALILKNRPDWQKGRYNCIGGHIEKDELPIECVVREFNEECGINTNNQDWHHIGCVNNENLYKVEVFTAIQKDIHGHTETMTDEEVCWFAINKLPENIITNLKWLIPYALNYWIQEKTEHLYFGIFNYKNIL